MALIVCKRCRKAFFNSMEEEGICPSCTARLKELYPIVRGFLRNNEKRAYTVREVSMIMGIPLEDIESMVSIGFLDYQSSGVPTPQNLKNTGGKV